MVPVYLDNKVSKKFNLFLNYFHNYNRFSIFLGKKIVCMGGILYNILISPITNPNLPP